jgi:tetratricopeptide (TPR) repeat protein
MANTARNKPGVERIQAEDTSISALDNLQVKYEDNKKAINTAFFVVLALIVGVFAYFKLYKEPMENKAATALSYPQQYFQTDSLSKALNGDGQHQGFLKVIKKYDGTKSANLAKYYAGLSYLQMGDFKNAIKFLEDFDAHGTAVKYAAYGALGDANMEMGNIKKGIEYYSKASENKDDMLLTPLYLYRAGLAFEMDKQADKAKDAYKRIRDEYPQSTQARDMDKFLARLGELN